jgi:hypothetical protein
MEGEEELIVNVVDDGDDGIVAADSCSLLIFLVESSWKGALDENDIRSSISSSAQQLIPP